MSIDIQKGFLQEKIRYIRGNRGWMEIIRQNTQLQSVFLGLLAETCHDNNRAPLTKAESFSNNPEYAPAAQELWDRFVALAAQTEIGSSIQ